MANVDRVNGLSPAGHITAGSYNGQSREYITKSDGSAIAVGDPVLITGTGDVEGRAEVDLAGVDAASITGVCVGVVVDAAIPATVHPGYAPASTVCKVMVCDDPGVLFEVQEDGNMGVVAIGETINHVTAGINTTTGTSGVEIDSSDTGTGLSFRVISGVRRVGNDPTTANAKWLVQINEHTRNSVAAGV
jgi:hypothetical protein